MDMTLVNLIALGANGIVLGVCAARLRKLQMTMEFLREVQSAWINQISQLKETISGLDGRVDGRWDKGRHDSLSKALSVGLMTTNEARSVLDLPPLDYGPKEGEQ